MAGTKTVLVLAIICFVLVHELGITMVEAQKIDCGSKCQERCSKAKKAEKCLKACDVCCAKCNCVPVGGNKESCPCYSNLKNNKGKSKCP